MPDPTPLPVVVVGLGESMYEYADKAEEYARLAMWAGVLAVALVVVLLATIAVTTGLRR